MWIEVEEVDIDGNHVTDLDLKFAECEEFDTLSKAIDYANTLYLLADEDRHMLKSPDGRFYWVTEVT